MRPSSAQRCKRREHLAGIEQALVVEGAFDALLLVEIDLGKHHRHQIALFDADAVLAGEHAADLDAQPQDIGAELLGAFELAGIVGVVEDQRMQIAVAGMEHVGDAQAVFRRHLLHALQHQRQLGARDGAVHAVDSPARCGRPPGTPPCGRPRTAAALLPSWRPGRSRRGRHWRSPPRARSGGRPRPAGRRARRSAAPRRRADSRHGRIPRPRGSPAGPSSPCRRG